MHLRFVRIGLWCWKEWLHRTSKNETPLNAYAHSKLLVDNYVRRIKNKSSQIVGLRYFNVYGPNEAHKGKMSSVFFHFHNQFLENRCVKLFKGTNGAMDGEQQRDFVYVEDVVKVNKFFMNNSSISGIYNVGSGVARSYNEVANLIVDKRSQISYFDMPLGLAAKYQNYTCADIQKLRQIGYQNSFVSIESGYEKYKNT